MRFMEALSEAICAFVCVRREETLVSGSGSGEVEGEGERERERDGISGLRIGSWVLGEGLRGWCWGGCGGDGDREVWRLRDVCVLFGLDLAATLLLVEIVPLGFSSAATTSFVLNFAFFATGFGGISSPPSSSPPKLSNVFAARFFGFFFAPP